VRRDKERKRKLAREDSEQPEKWEEKNKKMRSQREESFQRKAVAPSQKW
jgi:hypothetical protein